MSGPHRRFEEIVAGAFASADPVAAFDAAADDESLSTDIRAALRSVSADGVRLSVLLIAKLRFERLMRGSSELSREFDLEPEQFTSEVRAYCLSVPPCEFFPAAEVRSFLSWRATHGPDSNGG